MLTRALFLGTGVYVALLGAVLFLVDSVTMAPYAAGSAPRWLTMLTTTSAGQARILNPPDWTPYTLVGVGGVTILYAIALPRAAWKKD